MSENPPQCEVKFGNSTGGKYFLWGEWNLKRSDFNYSNPFQS